MFAKGWGGEGMEVVEWAVSTLQDKKVQDTSTTTQMFTQQCECT